MRFLLPAILAFCLPLSAQALVVAEGSTKSDDSNNIVSVTGTSTIGVANGAYSSEVTSPASDWVWVDDARATNNASFEFKFDLTGYKVSSASLSGRWGVDNYGSVLLNGNEIASLPSGAVADNFNNLHDYSTSSFFQAGVNTLRFNLFDEGGPAAFRATAIVDATPVPLPAGAVLLLTGLGAFGVRARRAARS